MCVSVCHTLRMLSLVVLSGLVLFVVPFPFWPWRKQPLQMEPPERLRIGPERNQYNYMLVDKTAGVVYKCIKAAKGWAAEADNILWLVRDLEEPRWVALHAHRDTDPKLFMDGHNEVRPVFGHYGDDILENSGEHWASWPKWSSWNAEKAAWDDLGSFPSTVNPDFETPQS